MDGIFGWLGGHSCPHDLLKTMGQAARPAATVSMLGRATHGFGAASVSRFGKASLQSDERTTAVIHGRPRFLDDELAAVARDVSAAAAILRGWERLQAKLPSVVEGSFALAVLQPSERRAFLALDRIGIERLCYGARDGSARVRGKRTKRQRSPGFRPRHRTAVDLRLPVFSHDSVPRHDLPGRVQAASGRVSGIR